MRYFLFICVCVFFAQVTLFGQAPVVKTKESGYGDITPERVQQFCDMLKKTIEDDLKDYSKISYAKYNVHYRTLGSWINYSFLELDSDIDTSWFKKIHSYVRFCYTTKKKYDLSPFNAEYKEQVTNKKLFEAAFENFKKFLKQKTPKANPQRVAYLKREKEKYLREKRAKERAEERASGSKKSLYD